MEVAEVLRMIEIVVQIDIAFEVELT